MLALEEMVDALCPRRDPSYQPKVGFEFEILLFDRATFTPLQMKGARGLQAVMARARELTLGTPLEGQPDKKLALPDGAYLSLEPGGQFEFSSPPVTSFAAIDAQVRRFVSLVDTLCGELELHAFFGGASPVHTVDDIGLVVATERYRHMDAYFPRVGTMGRRMMRQSCSLQVTFDAPDADAARDLVVACHLLSPVLTGFLAHAPFIDGAFSGYRTFRVPIWQHTDPARSGAIEGFWEPDFGIADYVRHIVRAPMFFVRKNGGLRDAAGLTFADYNARGFEGAFPTLGEFQEHNTTIFTDCRLKRTVEFRPLDAQDPSRVAPTVALLCGLLMGDEGRRGVQQLLASEIDRNYATVQLAWAEHGPSAGLPSGDGWRALEGLFAIARRTLPEVLVDGDAAAAALEPLQQLVAHKRTPADDVRERFPTAREWLVAGRTY